MVYIRKRQMILTCFNCIQLPGCCHQTRSPLSSCRLPAAIISVQSEGFEQRESAAFTWPLLSFVHIYPLFQAGMGSFQTRWSAGPCGTMRDHAGPCGTMRDHDFPSETVFACKFSTCTCYCSITLDSWMSLDVV